MLRFRCPNCGGVIGVDEMYAGKQKDCPHCGNMVSVPNAGRGTASAGPTRPLSALGAVALTVGVVVCLYQWAPWGWGSLLKASTGTCSMQSAAASRSAALPRSRPAARSTSQGSTPGMRCARFATVTLCPNHRRLAAHRTARRPPSAGTTALDTEAERCPIPLFWR